MVHRNLTRYIRYFSQPAILNSNVNNWKTIIKLYGYKLNFPFLHVSYSREIHREFEIFPENPNIWCCLWRKFLLTENFLTSPITITISLSALLSSVLTLMQQHKCRQIGYVNYVTTRIYFSETAHCLFSIIYPLLPTHKLPIMSRVELIVHLHSNRRRGRDSVNCSLDPMAEVKEHRGNTMPKGVIETEAVNV